MSASPGTPPLDIANPPMDRSWPDIAASYSARAEQLPDLAGMAALAARIESSVTLSRLYGWTSMHDLIIAQARPTYPYDGPRLILSPDFKGAVEFRYIDTMAAERQWRRLTPLAEAFARLEHFTDQLRWFPRKTTLASD